MAAGRSRRRVRVLPDAEALEPYRDRLLVISGLENTAARPGPGELAGQHSPSRGRVSDRRARQAHDRVVARARRVHGPARGDDARPRDPALVPGAFARGGRHGQRREHVRHRLQLRLPEHLVAQHHDADAARDQPARGLRAALRRCREHRPGRTAGPQSGRSGAFSIPCCRRCATCGGRSVPGTTSRSTSTWRRSGTSSGAFRRPRRRPTGSCRSSTRRQASGLVRRARAPDVRSAAARFPDRSHAGVLVHGRPRAERHDLPADRRARCAPSDLAPPERSELRAKIARINQYHVSLFAEFVDRLRSTPDGDGSLLDNVMILYGASLRDGNAHSYDDLNLLLGGAAAPAGSRAAGTSCSRPRRRSRTAPDPDGQAGHARRAIRRRDGYARRAVPRMIYCVPTRIDISAAWSWRSESTGGAACGGSPGAVRGSRPGPTFQRHRKESEPWSAT